MNSRSRDSGRQRLIDATLTSIGERGYHRSSLRAIAEFAGVTAGLVKHHFHGKDVLMLEAYRYFSERRLEAYLKAADDAGTDPVERLAAIARSTLLFNANRDNALRIWAGFVELVTANPDAATVQTTSREREVREIRGCVTGIYAARGEQLSPDAAQRLALGISSTIEGVWVEHGMNPSRMTPNEALNVALDMIGGSLSVSFAMSPENTT